MAFPTTEVARLALYNTGIYDSGSNPYGMDGYTSNLPLLASDAATLANWIQALDFLTVEGKEAEIHALAALSTEIAALGDPVVVTAMTDIEANLTAVQNAAANAILSGDWATKT